MIRNNIAKSMNEELMQVTYVAMRSNRCDLQDDYTSEDEVRKAKESFNKSPQRANLYHAHMTDSFEVIESYLAPSDLFINGIPVYKGEWLMTLQIHDIGLWENIKSGVVNGISIGAVADVEVHE